MKYVIMCGGKYKGWETPRQLIEYQGEPLVARTIRLLRENGVEDIAISSNNPTFERFGVPVLSHENSYYAVRYNKSRGYWCDAFYPTNVPTCYIFGDVLFSPEAIKTIVEYEGDDIMFFGSKRPFAPEYPKDHVEPFAFKVWDTDHLARACRKVKWLDQKGVFLRRPIAFELWYVICRADPRQDAEDIKDEKARNYVAINDYTCDIDSPAEIAQVLG